MECERINDLNRNLVNDFIRQHWHTTTMIIRGKVIDMTRTEGFYFRDNDNINAIRFYQKRGFDMAHLFRNSMDISRKLT